MAFELSLPGKIFMGEDALLLAKPTLASLGSKAFIVTGKVVTRTGLVDKLTAVLDELNIGYTIFNDIFTSRNIFKSKLMSCRNIRNKCYITFRRLQSHSL